MPEAKTEAAKILVVEDDAKIAKVLLDYLSASGYQAVHIGDGLQALQRLKDETFDVVLLDRMLPGLDGVSLCQQLRGFSHVPVIMLTALVDESDRLDGLDAGADDYVCKPFSPREVMARVKAQLRRAGIHATTALPTKLLEVNEANRSIAVKGQILNLTQVEFNIFAELIRHPSRVYTRQQLLDVARDDFRDSSDRTVDAHVKNIRKKIANFSECADCLRSVYGVGYRFELASQMG
nr:response regulator [uncultured Undibacterium sp.]